MLLAKMFLVAVAIAATQLAAAPASAARQAATLMLNPAVGPPTSLVKAKGSGFAAGEMVALTFDGSRVGSDVAGPTGKFTVRFEVPAWARPGGHVIEVDGVSSGKMERASFLVRTDWLQGCFDGGRSCFNPYENVLGRDTVGGLGLAWRAAVRTDGSSAPVYANGKLFVGTANGLVGLDPASGAIIINYRSGPVSTTPAVIRGFDPQPDPPGKVIFGSSDGILHAVSTAGPELWQVGLGARPTAPLVIQGVGDPTIRVVVGAGRTLYAFDASGNRQWATVLEGGDISKAAAVLTAPPDPDRVIVAAGDTLYALDAATGAVLWRSVPSGDGLGAPSVGDPNILVGDRAAHLFSVDPGTGEVVSTFIARSPILDSVAIGDPHIADPWLFADGGEDIYAIDQPDDFPPPVWTTALGGPIDGTPVLANGVVYAGTDPDAGHPTLFALDQGSGQILFTGLLPGGSAAGPVIADGRVIIATKSGDVLAYDGHNS